MNKLPDGSRQRLVVWMAGDAVVVKREDRVDVVLENVRTHDVCDEGRVPMLRDVVLQMRMVDGPPPVWRDSEDV